MPIKLRIKRKPKSKCSACSPCGGAGMQEAKRKKLKKIPKMKRPMERFLSAYFQYIAVTNPKMRRQLHRIYQGELGKKEKNQEFEQLVELVNTLLAEAPGGALELSEEQVKKIVLVGGEGLYIIPNVDRGIYYDGHAHFLTVQPDNVMKVLEAIKNHYREFDLSWDGYLPIIRMGTDDMERMFQKLKMKKPQDVPKVFNIVTAGELKVRDWSQRDFDGLIKYFPGSEEEEDSYDVFDVDPVVFAEELQEVDDDTGGTYGKYAPQPEDDDGTAAPRRKSPSYKQEQPTQDDLTRAGFLILHQKPISDALFQVMNKYRSKDFIKMILEDDSITSRIMNAIGNLLHGSQKEQLMNLIDDIKNKQLRELGPREMNLIEHYMATVALEFAIHAFHQGWDHRDAYKKFKTAERKYEASQDVQDREDMEIYERRAERALLEALMAHLEKYMRNPKENPFALSQGHIAHHDTYKGERLPDEIVYKLNEALNPPKRMSQDIINKWKRLLD